MGPYTVSDGKFTYEYSVDGENRERQKGCFKVSQGLGDSLLNIGNSDVNFDSRGPDWRQRAVANLVSR